MDIPEAVKSALAERYVIEHEIGAGGMATVYLAHDLRHDRKVALKVLRPELAALLGSARFLAEIRVTARLQHPHLLPLFDSGEAAGMLFYAMPYVAGESLRSRLQREHQLPISDVVALIQALAGALDYAHRQGVVHRDIKPENILLQDGQPMLADFGIALALASSDARMTETGLSLGTPQYMSPEQATGSRTLDARSDIYSLAAVAYELVVGEPPFMGPSAQVLLRRIALETPRSLRTARSTVPPAMEAAILKALEKSPSDRFASAAEFAAALTAKPPTRAHSWWRQRASSIALAVLIIAAIVMVVARPGLDRAFVPAMTSRQLTFSGKVLHTAITLDGQFLAYAAHGDSVDHVVVQDLAGGVPDTLITLPSADALDWSPDGTRLVVGSFNAAAAHGEVLILPRTGGAPRRLNVANSFPAGVYASWLPDGRHVSLHMDNSKRVLVVDTETEDTTSIPVPGDYASLENARWASDGEHLLVVTQYFAPARSELLLVSRTGKSEVLVRDSMALISSPLWPGGNTVYYARSDGSIWKLPLSRSSLRPQGQPRQIAAQLEALDVLVDRIPLSMTADGRVAYPKGRRFSNLVLAEPAGGDGVARVRAITNETFLRWSPTVSPDGMSIAFAQRTADGSELFRMPIEGGPPVRITNGARVRYPSYIAWSPDGGRIAYLSMRAGRGQVWVADVKTGALRAYPNAAMSTVTGHLAWAPGEHIAYQTDDQLGIEFLDTRDGSVHRLPVDDGMLFGPQYSTDGTKLGVLWNRGPSDRNAETGIWVFDLRDGSRRQVLRYWGYWPRGWSPDDQYIYLQRYSRGPVLFRIDARQAQSPMPFLTTPFRDVECSPAGRTQPNAFVCAAFDFDSDVWIIDTRAREQTR